MDNAVKVAIPSTALTSISVPAGLPLGASPRSLVGWVTRDASYAGTPFNIAFGYGPLTVGARCDLGQWADSNSLYAAGHAADINAAPVAFPVSTWVHVGLTYDGATARLYQDGQLVATAPHAWNTARLPRTLSA